MNKSCLRRVLLFVRPPFQSPRVSEARIPHLSAFPRSFSGSLRSAGGRQGDGQICHSVAKIGDADFVARCRDVSGWVVFSDLHVTKRTLPACIETLRIVRQEAEERGAGVLMLGDFWHHKGSLPVEPLNAVLSELRPWNFPMLMLTGNHDQVDLKGYLHALVPLAAGCPNVHVFDEPTSFMDAVFLSYHSDSVLLAAMMEKLVDQKTKAMFVHADVIGAIMNDTFRAKEGLHPDTFPPLLPVFSGHYHKPHIVDGTTIEYVGSPYQVSQAEAGQTKHLLILDNDWRVVERKPLDVGPRHFTLRDVSSEIPEDVRKGDRLRWYIDASDEDEIKAAEKVLRRKEVTVDVIVKPSSSAPRIEEAETLLPGELFMKYAESIEMTSGAIKKGEQVVKAVGGGDSSLQRTATTINFESVEVEGFGPFLETVNYPLDDGGVRVVCGRNEDDSSSQSNGAGKSMLVSAPLWAITGRIDVRGEMSGRPTNADIVHDEAKSARVKVTGTANGEPFVVERVVKRRGKGSLTFLMGEEDLTKAEVKMTQAEIDEFIHAETLASLAFFGHGNVTALLDANDTAFKAELGKIVDLEIWKRAREVTWNELKDKDAEFEKELYASQLLHTTLKELEAKLDSARNESQHWESLRTERQHVLQQSCEGNARSLAKHLIEGLNLAESIKSWLSWAETQNPTSSTLNPVAEEGANFGSFDSGGGGFARKRVFSFSVSERPPWDDDYESEEEKEVEQEAGSFSAAPWDVDFESERTGGSKKPRNVMKTPWDVEFESEQEEEQEAASSSAAPWDVEFEPDQKIAAKGKRRKSVKEAREESMSVLNGDAGIASENVELEAMTVLRAKLDDFRKRHFDQEKDAALKKGLFEASEKAYRSYLQLNADKSDTGTLTCDSCLQEIDSATFKKNCKNLKKSMDAASSTYLNSRSAASDLSEEVELISEQLSKRVKRWQEEEAEFRNAQRLAEEEEKRKREEEKLHQIERERRLAAQLETQMKAIREFEEKLALARGSVDRLRVMHGRMFPRLTRFQLESERVSERQKQGSRKTSKKNQWKEIADVDPLLENIPELISQAEEADYDLAFELENLYVVKKESNPHIGEVRRFTELTQEQSKKLKKSEEESKRLGKEKEILSELDNAFKPGGVSSFILEGMISDLQHRSARFIEHLSPGTLLELKCTKATKNDSNSLERISKEFTIRTAGGKVRERSLQQFSSGEVRRLALGLSLGFSTLISERGRLRCNIIVFDEALGQLDREGCERVVQLMETLPQSSTFLVGQEGSFVMQSFDVVDWVVKRNGASTVEVHPHKSG
ncbi:hypothetical protein BSKO_10083 [Bryopsis sp. KO-2023]|nr:hypothetical protein BSKO_10083 [Bryopsis sp. KO-2023]